MKTIHLMSFSLKNTCPKIGTGNKMTVSIKGLSLTVYMFPQKKKIRNENTISVIVGKEGDADS